MENEQNSEIKIKLLEGKLEQLEYKINNITQGEDFRFKALWYSLPICIALFGTVQYINFKSNNEQIDKSIQSAKEKIEDLKTTLNDNIKNQDKKISEIINTAVDGNLNNVNIFTIPINEQLLRAYPYIDEKTSDDGKRYFQISLTSYVAVKANLGERGYLVASSYKWGGSIAEKFNINEYNTFNPEYLINRIGYLNQEDKAFLITEYGSTLSYTAYISRATCNEAKRVVSELQQMKVSGWLDLTLIMKKIENKPTTKRFEIFVGELLKDCNK